MQAQESAHNSSRVLRRAKTERNDLKCELCSTIYSYLCSSDVTSYISYASWCIYTPAHVNRITNANNASPKVQEQRKMLTCVARRTRAALSSLPNKIYAHLISMAMRAIKRYSIYFMEINNSIFYGRRRAVVVVDLFKFIRQMNRFCASILFIVYPTFLSRFFSKTCRFRAFTEKHLFGRIETPAISRHFRWQIYMHIYLKETEWTQHALDYVLHTG